MGAETLAALFRHGATVPITAWIIGLVLIVAGVISMVRRASYWALSW